MPAAGSRWPTLDLIEPTRSGLVRRSPPSTRAIAEHSIGSPTAVPVQENEARGADAGSQGVVDAAGADSEDAAAEGKQSASLPTTSQSEAQGLGSISHKDVEHVGASHDNAQGGADVEHRSNQHNEYVSLAVSEGTGDHRGHLMHAQTPPRALRRSSCEGRTRSGSVESVLYRAASSCELVAVCARRLAA
jgi:hypothetical protein